MAIRFCDSDQLKNDVVCSSGLTDCQKKVLDVDFGSPQCLYCSGLRYLGDSLVLHCASLLRTMFASLARAQNVRDFPQTKPDSEINARFLLNEHGDPQFLFYKFNENNILNNWEKIGRNLWLLFGK